MENKISLRGKLLSVFFEDFISRHIFEQNLSELTYKLCEELKLNFSFTTNVIYNDKQEFLHIEISYKITDDDTCVLDCTIIPTASTICDNRTELNIKFNEIN